jgi:hypothetical protein
MLVSVLSSIRGLSPLLLIFFFQLWLQQTTQSQQPEHYPSPFIFFLSGGSFVDLLQAGCFPICF